MKQIENEDLVYKEPWIRTAQQSLFQTLENDYGFPKATCRSLVNLMWDFLNEICGEKTTRTKNPAGTRPLRTRRWFL